MKQLIAFHGDAQLKERFLIQLENHRKADQIIQGTYEDEKNGKWRGCAVGCSIHSLNLELGKSIKTNDHKAYADTIGITEQLAYLEDRIFEGLPLEKAVFWPRRFGEAIQVGADVSLVIAHFLVWNMEHQIPRQAKFPDVQKVLQDVANRYKRVIKGDVISESEWEVVIYAAESAKSAWCAESAWSAESAAESAESAAKSAWCAESAESAAKSAKAAAKSAWCAESAESAESAWSAEYELMADILIKLLETAPVPERVAL